MSNIKGLIFDAGDVIYDASKWRKWLYKQLKEKIKINLSYSELFFLWDNYYLREIYIKHENYTKIFINFLIDINFPKKEIEEFLIINNLQKKEIENKTRPYKWVYKYFSLLKEKKKKIGILSDSEQSSRKIAKRFEKWEILQYIDTIVSSKDTNYIKPYPQAYYYILKKLKIKVENTVFVGHDKDELIGAKLISLETINYNNKNEFFNFIENVLK